MTGTDPSGERRLLPYGDCGVLVAATDLADAMRLGGWLRAARDNGRLAGVVDLVPAARSVLVVAADQRAQGAVAAAVRGVLDPMAGAGDETGDDEVGADEAGHQEEGSEAVEIPVRYDGLDLDEVARLSGLDAAGVVQAHTAASWVVGFTGFAPGFCYLVDADHGADSPLAVPRRDEPRTKVPAGAVALAGEFSGVYPRQSPGGWQLIGSTDTRMWDLDREPPALLRPGDTVRFVDEGSSR